MQDCRHHSLKLIALTLLFTCMLKPTPALSAHFTPKGDDHGKASIDPSEANYKEGVKRLGAGDADGAIDSFLQAVYFARNNYYPNAYYYLGIAYEIKHQDDKAIKALLTHLQQVIGPSYNAHCELAEIYIRNQRLDEARTQANQAITSSAGITPSRAYYLEGKVSESEGNLSYARMSYDEALGRSPWHYTAAWLAIAELDMKTGNWSDAASKLTGMVQAQDDLKNFDAEHVYLDLGLCLVQRGDHQGAFECWRKAEAVNPNSAKAHLSMAKLFDMEQHISSAIEEYQAYLRVDPKGKDAQAVKDRLISLDQAIHPPDMDPAPIKPTPAMRKQQATDQAEIKKQKEDRAESGF